MTASSVKIVFYKVPELKNLKSIFYNHSSIAELGFAGLLKAMLISDILLKLSYLINKEFNEILEMALEKIPVSINIKP